MSDCDSEPWCTEARQERDELKLENERLRAWAEDEQQKRHKVEEDRLMERQENERLRVIVAVFEADEARWSSKPDAKAYCYRECIAPKLRAACQQDKP